MPGPQFWAIAVADLSLADWYADHFELEASAPFTAGDGSRVTILRGESLIVELKQRREQIDRVDGAVGYFKVGWFVESVDNEKMRLEAQGVEVLTPVIEQSEFGIRFFLIADPEGNLIQIFEHL
jgi:predicted enzyme related to lactoylglutathione lyase